MSLRFIEWRIIMNEEERYRLLRLVEHSHEHWTSKKLPAPYIKEEERLHWLDEQAPYGLLVQNTGAEPFFIYANKQAQLIFGYSLEEFLSMPSRRSAPPQKQKARRRMLESVDINGIHEGYHGIRVDKQGTLFEIKDGLIWKLINESGETIGIVAMIWKNDL